MKKTLPKKIVATVLAACLSAGTLLGNVSNTFAASASQAPKATTQPAKTAPGKPTLPIFPEKVTLKYFCVINGAMSSTMSTYNDVEAFKEIEKRTNVHIEWIHPASGSAGNEQFSLMIASSSLPDLINWPFGGVKGGSEALLRDKVVTPITPADAYKYMPNYMYILDNNPVTKRNSLLDDGTMFQIVNFNYDPATNKTVDFKIKGPYIRMDWVDAVGKRPKTIDELYTVLKAMKDKNVNGKANFIPFVDDKSLTATKAIAGSFGVRQDMQMKDGKVAFGPILPEFKTYLTYMNKWYKEGLINSDYPVLESRDAKILNSDAAFTIGSMGSGLTMARESLLSKDPSTNLDSLPYLEGPGGHKAIIDDIGKNPRATAITSANKHPKETLKWLDYFYSTEGATLATFGIENKSYTKVNGKPVLADLVMKDTQKNLGYSQEEAIARYSLGPINFPYARWIGFYQQVNLNTAQKERIQTNWSTGSDEIIMSPLTLNIEESTQYANIYTDTKTYVDEMVLKFILGQEPLENFDKFAQKIKDMKIDKAIAIQQKALDRFNSRNK